MYTKSKKTNIRLCFGLLTLAIFCLSLFASVKPAQAAITNVDISYDSYPLKKNASGAYEIHPGRKIDVRFDSDAAVPEGSQVSLGEEVGDVKYDEESGYYTALILTPNEPNVTVPLRANWANSKLADISIIPAPAITDPSDQPAFGVRVILYFIDQFGLKQIWSTPLRRQINPQRTDFTGTYSYYVPAGKYVLEVTGAGYEDFQTAEFEFDDYGFVDEELQLSYVSTDNVDNVLMDASIVALLDVLMKHIQELRQDEQVAELTRELLKPASWLVMLTTLLTFIFSLISQFGFSLFDLPNMGMHFLQFLMQIFRGKSGKKKWGKVYEHFTQEPIPMAAVMLFHEPDHKLAHMTLTEVDGTYGLPQVEGSYSLFVSKKGFKFPPRAQQFVYKGEPFHALRDTLPSINIAMDYDEESEKTSAAFTAINKTFSSGHFLLTLAGFGVGIWTMIIKFTFASLVMMGFYLWIISNRISMAKNNRQVNKIAKQVRGRI